MPLSRGKRSSQRISFCDAKREFMSSCQEEKWSRLIPETKKAFSDMKVMKKRFAAMLLEYFMT
jgi:hypothetical protein